VILSSLEVCASEERERPRVPLHSPHLRMPCPCDNTSKAIASIHNGISLHNKWHLPPQQKASASTLNNGICLHNKRHLPPHQMAFANTTKGIYPRTHRHSHPQLNLHPSRKALHRLQRNLQKLKYGWTHQCQCSSPSKLSGMISARQPLILSRQSCHRRLFSLTVD